LLLKVVRDPPGEPPDRFHLRRLLQLPLHLLALALLRPLRRSARLRFVMSR